MILPYLAPMFLDLNQDGKFDLADLLILAEDPALAKPLGTLLGYAIKATATPKDDAALAVAVQVLSHAQDTLAYHEASAREYIESAMQVAGAIIGKIEDEDSRRIASASLAGAKAFVDALEWEDGTDAFEVMAAFSALTGPIISAFLRR